VRADAVLGHTHGLGLLSHHGRASHHGLTLLHHTRISVGNQALSGGPGSIKSVAHHEVGAQTKRHLPSTGVRLSRDPRDARRDLLRWLDPHQVHLSVTRCQ
jgi:hypothetical protein